MRQKLSELFSARRAPTGYRPGVTLEYLRRNLGRANFTSAGPAKAVLFLEEIDLKVDIVERTESQLLMHLVMTEFTIRVPASEEGSARFGLHHSGSIRRTGLRCKQLSGEPVVLARLQAALKEDQALHQALMLLDFKRLCIDLDGHEWHVRIEHMGGSEVVNRMPSFRRYIALSGLQRDVLFSVLASFQRVLGRR
ncbi:hypothetical protein ASC74_15830 [Pseudomonas sp. Root329]|uniref:DUF3156 family protein n=1 Tax=Pseudomonas sp. Root329 TaxID=1736515 RepID=UPI0006FB2A00|nr:DUF3156 family protein [Pseudomonas sp. Root329]KQV22658.1 hypothetical protein ASC74_15830 [Pseudomonas sp. Root329]